MRRGDEHRSGVATRRPTFAALLIESGRVSSERVNEALAEGERTGESLAEVLIRREWATEDDVARLHSEQSGCPYLSPGSFTVEPDASGALPPDEALLLEAFVIGFDGKTPIVAVADPIPARVTSVRQRLGDDVSFTIVTVTTLTELLVGAVRDAPAAVTRPADTVELEPPVQHPDDAGMVLADLDALAEAVAALRGRVERLAHSSAEAAQEREHNREAIKRLEEQLAQRTNVVADLKTKLGDFMSGLEAVG